MLKYSLKRVLLAFITAFIILTLTFFLVKSLPAVKVFSPQENVRYAFYMDQYHLGYVTYFTKTVAEVENGFVPAVAPLDQMKIGNEWFYFYQRPIVEQYFTWLGNIVTKWDWGRSTAIEPNASAILIIAQRLPASMSVNIVSVIISVPLGIGFGILAGLKKIHGLTTPFQHQSWCSFPSHPSSLFHS